MASEVEVEALRAVPIFRTTEPRLLQLLAFLSEREDFRDGELLCRQGEHGDSAYVLLAGQADIWVSGPQGRAKVASLGRNEIVGEMAVICDIPRTADVVASGDVSALRIGKDQLLRMLRDAPDMALEMMRSLAQRLNDTTMALSARG